MSIESGELGGQGQKGWHTLSFQNRTGNMRLILSRYWRGPISQYLLRCERLRHVAGLVLVRRGVE